MQQLLKELKSLLDKEVALHEELKGDLALELENDGQLSGADYLKVQQSKFYRAHQIETLERKRIGQVSELTRKISAAEEPGAGPEGNTPPRSLTLKEIIAQSPPEMGKELQGCHDALSALVNEIRRMAREAGGIAQARLKAIDATLSVIGETVKMHPTYSGEGRLEKRTPTFKQTSA